MIFLVFFKGRTNKIWSKHIFY